MISNVFKINYLNEAYPPVVLMRVRLTGGGALSSFISTFGSMGNEYSNEVSGLNFGIDSSSESAFRSSVSSYTNKMNT